MLILTRRTGETLCIGDDVTIMVLGVIGNQVRLGISAPKSVSIDRSEIRARKKREAMQQRDPNGDIDGNRIDPALEDPGPEGDAGPMPEPPPSASSRTLKLATPYRPRVANPDSLDHRRKLEGLR